MKCPICEAQSVSEKWSNIILSQYGESKVRPLCFDCLEFYAKVIRFKRDHPSQAKALLALLQGELEAK
jgi:hypothetical protein